MKTELHLVSEIPQSCDCAESICIKLMTHADLSALSAAERNRVWTLRAHNGANWLDFGVATSSDVEGYILMPIKLKFPDDADEEEATREWVCPECEETRDVSYSELVEQGKPKCEGCEVDMNLVVPTPPTPAETPATEDAPANTSEATTPSR